MHCHMRGFDRMHGFGRLSAIATFMHRAAHQLNDAVAAANHGYYHCAFPFFSLAATSHDRLLPLPLPPLFSNTLKRTRIRGLIAKIGRSRDDERDNITCIT